MAGMATSGLFAIAFLLAARVVRGGYMDLVSFKDRHADAVCLDGTPSGYHYRPADSDEGKRMWIVYLESGGWCYDPEGCAERCVKRPELCTSTVWPESIKVGGILSGVNEDLHVSLRTANKVFLRYCSSDAHMGDAEAFGLQFRGQRVVQALLTDLVELYGLGRGGPGAKDTLLFGGGSAGARGAMVHLDYVPAMLGNAAADVKVIGFLDSPLWLDIEPLNDRGDEALLSQSVKVHNVSKATHLGADCAAAYPDEPGKCLLGEYRMPYVTTPYLMVAALHDGFQIWSLMGVPPEGGWSEEELEYAEKFANRTATVLEHLASRGHAVLGASCNTHSETLSDKGFFGKSTEDGVTVSYALHHLLGLAEGAEGVRTVIKHIDACRTLDCGSGCHRCDNRDDDSFEAGCGPEIHELNAARDRRALGLAALAAAAALARA